MSWKEALEYGQGPGVAIIVGFALSVLVEYWPGYGKLLPKIKRLVFFAFCLAVPVIAAGLAVLSKFQGPGWELTWWPALQSGFVAFTAGTLTHLPRLPKVPEPPPPE